MTKFTVNKKDIQNALRKIVQVTRTKTTIPITAFVIIKAENGKINMTATNLNVRIETSCDAEISENGEFSFHALKLDEAVNKSKSEVITIEEKEGKNIFKSGKFKFESSNLPVLDFPLNNFTKCDKSLKVNAQMFINALDSVKYAINKDDSRKPLKGVKFEPANNVLKLVGTDGKRLSISEVQSETINDFECILQKDNIDFMKYFNGEIMVSTNDKEICISDGITSVYSKLIEGNYPNYKQIIPEKSTSTIRINSENIVSCLDNIMIAYVGESSFASFTIENNSVKVECKNDKNNVNDEFGIIYEGEKLVFSANPLFVKDIFSNCNDEFLEMSILDKDGFSPIRFDGVNYISVFMPILHK